MDELPSGIACLICTFLNAPDSRICDCCSTPLPGGNAEDLGTGSEASQLFSALPAQPVDESTGESARDASTSGVQGVQSASSCLSPASLPSQWACEACTLYNAFKAKRCSVCGTKRPSDMDALERQFASVQTSTSSLPNSARPAPRNTGKLLAKDGFPSVPTAKWFPDFEVKSMVSRHPPIVRAQCSPRVAPTVRDDSLQNHVVRDCGVLVLPFALRIAAAYHGSDLSCRALALVSEWCFLAAAPLRSDRARSDSQAVTGIAELFAQDIASGRVCGRLLGRALHSNVTAEVAAGLSICSALFADSGGGSSGRAACIEAIQPVRQGVAAGLARLAMLSYLGDDDSRRRSRVDPLTSAGSFADAAQLAFSNYVHACALPGSVDDVLGVLATGRDQGECSAQVALQAFAPASAVSLHVCAKILRAAISANDSIAAAAAIDTLHGVGDVGQSPQSGITDFELSASGLLPVLAVALSADGPISESCRSAMSRIGTQEGGGVGAIDGQSQTFQSALHLALSTQLQGPHALHRGDASCMMASAVEGQDEDVPGAWCVRLCSQVQDGAMLSERGRQHVVREAAAALQAATVTRILTSSVHPREGWDSLYRATGGKSERVAGNHALVTLRALIAAQRERQGGAVGSSATPVSGGSLDASTATTLLQLCSGNMVTDNAASIVVPPPPMSAALALLDVLEESRSQHATGRGDWTQQAGPHPSGLTAPFPVASAGTAYSLPPLNRNHAEVSGLGNAPTDMNPGTALGALTRLAIPVRLVPSPSDPVAALLGLVPVNVEVENKDGTNTRAVWIDDTGSLHLRADTAAVFGILPKAGTSSPAITRPIIFNPSGLSMPAGALLSPIRSLGDLHAALQPLLRRDFDAVRAGIVAAAQRFMMDAVRASQVEDVQNRLAAQTEAQAARATPTNTTLRPMCRTFQRRGAAACRYGDACKYAHTPAGQAREGVAPPSAESSDMGSMARSSARLQSQLAPASADENDDRVDGTHVVGSGGRPAHGEGMSKSAKRRRRRAIATAAHQSSEEMSGRLEIGGVAGRALPAQSSSSASAVMAAEPSQTAAANNECTPALPPTQSIPLPPIGIPVSASTSTSPAVSHALGPGERALTPQALSAAIHAAQTILDAHLKALPPPSPLPSSPGEQGFASLPSYSAPDRVPAPATPTGHAVFDFGAAAPSAGYSASTGPRTASLGVVGAPISAATSAAPGAVCESPDATPSLAAGKAQRRQPTISRAALPTISRASRRTFPNPNADPSTTIGQMSLSLSSASGGLQGRVQGVPTPTAKPPAGEGRDAWLRARAAATESEYGSGMGGRGGEQYEDEDEDDEEQLQEEEGGGIGFEELMLHHGARAAGGDEQAMELMYARMMALNTGQGGSGRSRRGDGSTPSEAASQSQARLAASYSRKVISASDVPLHRPIESGPGERGRPASKAKLREAHTWRAQAQADATQAALLDRSCATLDVHVAPAVDPLRLLWASLHSEPALLLPNTAAGTMPGSVVGGVASWMGGMASRAGTSDDLSHAVLPCTPAAPYPPLDRALSTVSPWDCAMFGAAQFASVGAGLVNGRDATLPSIVANAGAFCAPSEQCSPPGPSRCLPGWSTLRAGPVHIREQPERGAGASNDRTDLIEELKRVEERDIVEGNGVGGTAPDSTFPFGLSFLSAQRGMSLGELQAVVGAGEGGRKDTRVPAWPSFASIAQAVSRAPPPSPPPHTRPFGPHRQAAIRALMSARTDAEHTLSGPAHAQQREAVRATIDGLVASVHAATSASSLPPLPAPLDGMTQAAHARLVGAWEGMGRGGAASPSASEGDGAATPSSIPIPGESQANPGFTLPDSPLISALKAMYDVTAAVGVRGLWFALVPDVPLGEVEVHAPCLWGPALWDVPILERAAALSGLGLSAPTRARGLAQAGVRDALTRAGTHASTQAPGSEVSYSVCDRPLTIVWGTLGPHPAQRPPPCAIVLPLTAGIWGEPGAESVHLVVHESGPPVLAIHSAGRPSGTSLAMGSLDLAVFPSVGRIKLLSAERAPRMGDDVMAALTVLSALRRTSRQGAAPAPVLALSQALSAITADPLACMAHATAWSAGTQDALPGIVQAVMACPGLVPLAVRLAYLHAVGFGLLRTCAAADARFKERDDDVRGPGRMLPVAIGATSTVTGRHGQHAAIDRVPDPYDGHATGSIRWRERTQDMGITFTQRRAILHRSGVLDGFMSILGAHYLPVLSKPGGALDSSVSMVRRMCSWLAGTYSPEADHAIALALCGASASLSEHEVETLRAKGRAGLMSMSSGSSTSICAAEALPGGPGLGPAPSPARAYLPSAMRGDELSAQFAATTSRGETAPDAPGTPTPGTPGTQTARDAPDDEERSGGGSSMGLAGRRREAAATARRLGQGRVVDTEEGHGLGPTQEAYTLACREAQRTYAAGTMITVSATGRGSGGGDGNGRSTFGIGLRVWHSPELLSEGEEGDGVKVRQEELVPGNALPDPNNPFVFAPNGLHPAPVLLLAHGPLVPSPGSLCTVSSPSHGPGALACLSRHWECLGRLVGKALSEGRPLDFPVSQPFARAVLSLGLLGSSPCNGGLEGGAPPWAVASLPPAAVAACIDLSSLDPALMPTADAVDVPASFDLTAPADAPIPKVETALTMPGLAAVDPACASSCAHLVGILRARDEALAAVRRAVLGGRGGQEGQHVVQVLDAAGARIDWLASHVDDLCLDYSCPGYPAVSCALLPAARAARAARAVRSSPAPNHSAAELVAAVIARGIILPEEVESSPEGVTDSQARALAMALCPPSPGSLTSATATTSHEYGLSCAVRWTDLERWAVGQGIPPSSPPGRTADAPYRLSLEPSALPVCLPDLHVYVAGVMRTLLVDGVVLQATAFARGLAFYAPGVPRLLRLLTPPEFCELLCGAGAIEDDRLWSVPVLLSAIRAGPGYASGSQQMKWLAEAIAGLPTVAERRLFLRFVSGAARLPPGGFSGLRPPLNVTAVNERDVSSRVPLDTVLPSCNTCQRALKLPRYSSKAALEAKLRVAIHEGQGAFTRD